MTNWIVGGSDIAAHLSRRLRELPRDELMDRVEALRQRLKDAKTGRAEGSARSATPRVQDPLKNSPLSFARSLRPHWAKIL